MMLFMSESRDKSLRSLSWNLFTLVIGAVSAISIVYAFLSMAWIGGRPGEAFPGGEYRGIPVAIWNLPLAFFGVFWLLIRGSRRYGARYVAWEAKRPSRGKVVYLGTIGVGLLLLTATALIFSVTKK